MCEGLLQDVISQPTLLRKKLVPHLHKPEFTVINFISGHKKVKC